MYNKIFNMSSGIIDSRPSVLSQAIPVAKRLPDSTVLLGNVTSSEPFYTEIKKEDFNYENIHLWISLFSKIDVFIEEPFVDCPGMQHCLKTIGEFVEIKTKKWGRNVKNTAKFVYFHEKMMICTSLVWYDNITVINNMQTQINSLLNK